MDAEMFLVPLIYTIGHYSITGEHRQVQIALDASRSRAYNFVAADSFGVKEVSKLYAYIVDLLISVTAGIISYYICKWLDGE